MVGIVYFLGAALFVSAAAAAYDLKTGHMPNWLTLGPLAAAPIAHFVVDTARFGAKAGLLEAGYSVVGALSCCAIPALLYRLGAIGGGDVKLFAAIGALLLPLIGIEAEFYGFVAAALFAPARMAWEGKLLRVLGNTLGLVVNPFLPKAKRREITPEMLTWMRLGPFIFVGVLVEAILHWRGI